MKKLFIFTLSLFCFFSLFSCGGDLISAVQISPEGGTKVFPIEVTLTCPTPMCQIFYTIDGSEPTQASSMYSKPIQLLRPATVKAIAIIKGPLNIQISSDPTEMTYSGVPAKDSRIYYKNCEGAENPNPNFYYEGYALQLKIPTKKGFHCVGWFSDAEFTKPITAIDKTAKGNQTVYAQWVEAYTVTFDLEFYGLTKEPIVGVPKGSTLTAEQLAVEKVGYEGFMWWNMTEDVEFIPGESLVNQDLVLSAEGIRINYPITYANCEGVVYNGNLPEYTIEDEFTLYPAEKPGFEFVAWYEGDKKIESVPEGSTGPKTFTAEWKDIPPMDVRNIKTTGCKSGQLTLQWDNPQDIDLDLIKIECVELPSVNCQVKKGIQTASMSGFTENRQYTFKFVSVDLAGMESKGFTRVVDYFYLAESCRKLESVTLTTEGTARTFERVEFGLYPKNLKPTEVALSSTTVTINGVTCQVGNDGYYYMTERIGEVDKSFRLEPLRWRVLDKHYKDATGTDKGQLLFCEEAVRGTPYQEATGIYERSRLRAYFNGYEYIEGYNNSNCKDFLGKGFLQTAFSAEAQKQLVAVELDNSEASTLGRGETIELPGRVYNNTNDKVFALNAVEATTAEYGFEDAVGAEKSRTRACIATEYAQETGASAGWDPEGAAIWWLRSAHYGSGDGARTVSNGPEGSLGAYAVNQAHLSAVPAVVVSASAF